MSVEEELERWYDVLNENVFSCQLPNAVFTVYCSEQRKKSSIIYESGKVYNIYIHRNVLHGEIDKIITFIIHEQVHIYCRIKKISDTSRNCRYHNNRYAAVAEEHGLILEYRGTEGYVTVGTDDEILKSLPAFINRDRWGKILSEYEIRYQNRLNYDKGNFCSQVFACENCNNKAVGQERTRIICDKCRTLMVPVIREKNTFLPGKYKTVKCPGCRRKITGIDDGKYICGFCFEKMIDTK